MPPIQKAIRDLTRILRSRTKRFRLKDYLEPEEIVSGRIWEEEEETLLDCVRDRVDDEDGEDGVWRLEKKNRQMQRKALRERTQREGNTFGSHIQDLPTLALARVVIGGYTHVVPVVVDACVEELYRTGAYEPHLFRSLPNRQRLLDLVSYFDQGPARAMRNNLASAPNAKIYAKTPSLHAEQAGDICALLVTYLSSLPDSLIHRSLSDALWAWCVSPSIIRQEQRLRRRGDDDASESEYETSESEDENAPSYNTRLRQMEVERLTLPHHQGPGAHCAARPPPPSSTTFLAPVPPHDIFATLLVCPENGLSADDIGRIFCQALMGRKDKMHGEQEDTKDADQPQGYSDRRERERKTMVWLVNHWERISAAYESKKESRRPRAGRTRSASMGDEEELRRRSSQGENMFHSRGTSAGRDDQAEKHYSARRASAPALRQPQDLPPRRVAPKLSMDANFALRPPPLESRASGSTASSTELDSLDGHQHTPAPQARSSKQIPQRQDNVRILDGDDHVPDIALQREMSRCAIADDASVYSDVDVLDGVLGSYIDEPPRKTRQTSSNAYDRPIPGLGGRTADDSRPRSDIHQENADLRQKLEQVLRERDEARETVSAMRRIVQGSSSS
ncbi:hypothetical protein NM688_g2675 [Phlebia brevispora]|uniref:Uncharacterized protein n=1 Tax=Phlebia brevispora TaxID=194682 RepID=A0ACC1T7Y8_9APHY|nr:hypothetical protein NM688_g2675 [Phlebia brevispora]